MERQRIEINSNVGSQTQVSGKGCVAIRRTCLTLFPSMLYLAPLQAANHAKQAHSQSLLAKNNIEVYQSRWKPYYRVATQKAYSAHCYCHQKFSRGQLFIATCEKTRQLCPTSTSSPLIALHKLDFRWLALRDACTVTSLHAVHLA